MSQIVLPRLLRVASFRFAALYVALFTASAFVLGVAVFVESRSALQQQMAARIETESAFLREEFHTDGLYQRPYLMTASAHGREAIDRILVGSATSAFQASQQASTIAA